MKSEPPSGDGFPKHPLHKIICIGALIAERQPAGWEDRQLGAPHIEQRNEADIIRTFIDCIRELRRQLITFNGHGFDLPVLRYRAMVNRESGAALVVRPYFHRYAEDALDLCDVFGSYSPGAKIKLHEICKIVGLPGKPYGIDGGQVEAMIGAGRINEVAQYCEVDVLNTYRLWLIYDLFRGVITAEQLAFSEAHVPNSFGPAKPKIRIFRPGRIARLRRSGAGVSGWLAHRVKLNSAPKAARVTIVAAIVASPSDSAVQLIILLGEGRRQCEH